MKTWPYFLRLVLFGGVALVAGLLLAFGLVARRGALTFLYPARQPVQSQPAEAYQNITLTTADGLRLAAWYTPPRNGVVILAAHGAGSRRQAGIHDLFVRQGYGVVSWDFRGHGQSDGKLCTYGYYEELDMEAALEYALAQTGVNRIGAWGLSMGGVTAINTAAVHPEIAAVVADSAFARLSDELEIVVQIQFLRGPVRFFGEREAGVSLEAVQPVTQIGKLQPRPVFIIQGLADQVVPAASGQRLYAAAGEPRQLWEGPGVGHGAMREAYPAEYDRRVIRFFNQALLNR